MFFEVMHNLTYMSHQNVILQTLNAPLTTDLFSCHFIFLQENQNLYGAHPFYLNIDSQTGYAHGVFLLNSNAMGKIYQVFIFIFHRTIRICMAHIH